MTTHKFIGRSIPVSAVISLGLLCACSRQVDPLGGPLGAESGEGTDAGTANASSGSATAGDDGSGGGGGGGGSGDGDGGGGSGDGDGGGEPKFDVASPDGGEGGECAEGGGHVEFSHIWIANSAESTITKLNTVTLVEEGRYLTRGYGRGDPSRTSVNLSGDVAVANRNGGVTKFYARIEDCRDTNGAPGIQTSTGKDDVLGWDMEECRAWHTPIDTDSNRPVAWTAGTFDEQSCRWTNQKVWTAKVINAAPMVIQILRLDGATGAIEDVVPAPDVPVGWSGAYGGAVDEEDNFWFSTKEKRPKPSMLGRVRNDDLTLQIWPVPDGVHAYGMTFDNAGHAWVAGGTGGVARFDVKSEKWDVVDSGAGFGMQADGEGRVWVGSRSATWGGWGRGTFAIDVETLDVLDFIPIDNASQTKGVSIDFYGYVWVVEVGNSAHRVDPDTHETTSYDGLYHAYTYSDMTGWGLANVAIRPEG